MKEDVYIYYVRKNKMRNIRTNTHLRIHVLLLNDINDEDTEHDTWERLTNELTFLLLTLFLYSMIILR